MIEFREAITACFQDYFKFSGRARRPEFWWFFLFVFVVSLLLSAIDAAAFGEDMLLGLNGLFGLFVLVPQLAVSWRRLHDIGLSGWYNLLPVVPLAIIVVSEWLAYDMADVFILHLMSGIGSLVVTIIVLIWLIRPGQTGENRFGPEPPK